MTSEIIGRGAELSVVQAFLDRPTEGLRALVLEGDAGIGKSTLWLAGVAAARERSLDVLTSRPAEAERTLAHVVLGDLFADADPALLAALPAPRRRAFESALLREEPDLAVDPRALGVAILSLLSGLVRERPLVLAIDDDQWMDASSAATLGFALRRALHQPVLLLLSRRRDGPLATELEEAIDPTEVERLHVGPLSIGAIQLLVQRRMATTFSRPTLLRLHEASGGNPFFALELVRASSGDPSRDPNERFKVPPSLQRLVAARLDALEAPMRQTLLLIAAHGRLPVALLGTLEVPPEALDQARAGNVIEVADGVVRFTHPLLASALYQAPTDEERRAAHWRLATVVQDPVHRARHLALAAAAAPDATLASTIESAANLARDRSASIAAAELAEHALRLTPSEHLEDRLRRAAAAARAHSAAGDGNRARVIAADMLAEAPTGRARAEALLLGSEFQPPAAAVAMLDEALTEAAGAPQLQAMIHAGLAENQYFAKNERAPSAERHARASLRVAERVDDNALRATALSILALNRFGIGAPGALELAERAYRLAAPLNDPKLLQKAGWSVGHVLTWMGETDPARDWLERRLADWTDRDEGARSVFLWYLALVELWAGRWSVASAYADESAEIRVQYGVESPFDPFPAALLALHQGHIERGRSLSEHAMSMGGEGQLLGDYSAIIGACDLWSGAPEAAIFHFARAEEAADAVGSHEPSMRWWRPEHVEALLQVARIDEAADLTAEWETAARRLGRERLLAQAVRCRGLIAAARADVPMALGLLEEAVILHQKAGDPFGRARAEFALGVNRRRARQKRTAREALDAALAGFEVLGAATWAAAARSELARIGGRTRVAGLSPSELRVAALVAEGRTNREIASVLFLGERTVASHLTHIYAKLGIRSRTELARQPLPHTDRSARDSSKVQTS